MSVFGILMFVGIFKSIRYSVVVVYYTKYRDIG